MTTSLPTDRPSRVAGGTDGRHRSAATLRRCAAHRWTRVGAVGAALGGYVAFFGLPLASFLVFVWTGLCVAALGRTKHPVTFGQVIRDWAPLFLIVFAYDILRGLADDLSGATHLLPQLRFDEWLAGGTAPTVALQRHLHPGSAFHWWDYLAWFVYLTHFFLSIGVAGFLWRRDRARFHRYRALLVTLVGSAFVTYVAYPAAPPWMAADRGLLPPVHRIVSEMWLRTGGVVPTGADAPQATAHGVSLANDIAAVPSLHAALPMLLFLVSLRWWRRLAPLCGLYALLMAATLVYAGEHYVADILAGWAYAAVVMVVVPRLHDRWLRRHAPPVVVPPACRVGVPSQR